MKQVPQWRVRRARGRSFKWHRFKDIATEFSNSSYGSHHWDDEEREMFIVGSMKVTNLRRLLRALGLKVMTLPHIEAAII